MIPGVNYLYTVEVLNFNGPSEKSDAVYRSACIAPEIFHSLQIQSTSSEKIVLLWQQPADDGGCTIQGYELWRDDGSLGDFVPIDTDIGQSTFSYEATGLT